jgi:arsenate reductase (thioredoxin)
MSVVTPNIHNILILCTHNSARSILAEGMLNFLAQQSNKNIKAFSAGSSPRTSPHPLAIKVLSDVGVDVSKLRSKNWDEFTQPDAEKMRVVITVCDNAANEPCPFWPGAPVQAHWGFPDPSLAEGGEDVRLKTFHLTRQAIAYKLIQLLQLPFDTMDDVSLRQELARIGRS